MKKIVLSKEANRIVWVALRKKRFLRKFVKNPKKASTAARIRLTPDDVRTLRALLRANISVKGKELFAVINAVHNGAGIRSIAAKLPPKPPPPPPPWMLIIKIRSRGI